MATLELSGKPLSSVSPIEGAAAVLRVEAAGRSSPGKMSPGMHDARSAGKNTHVAVGVTGRQKRVQVDSPAPLNSFQVVPERPLRERAPDQPCLPCASRVSLRNDLHVRRNSAFRRHDRDQDRC